MRWFFVFLVLFVVIPGVGYGHSPIKEAVPSSGDVLVTSPQNVAIAFSKPVEPAFSRIEVFHMDGTKVSEKTTFSEDNTRIEVWLKETVSSGKYTVKWRCMSLDGHSKTGSYNFTVQ